MRLPFVLLAALLCLPGVAQTSAVRSFGDFEEGKAWSGGTITTATVKTGTRALLFEPTPEKTAISTETMPTDWSGYDRLSFWLHSDRANGQVLTIVLNSENPANGKDWDYYFNHLKIDWTGWRLITLRKGEELSASRRPLGWNQIQSLSLNTTGWDHQLLPDTRLVFDDFRISRDTMKLQLPEVRSDAATGGYNVKVAVTNLADRQQTISLAVSNPELKLFKAPQTIAPVTVPPGRSAEVTLVFAANPQARREPLAVEYLDLIATGADGDQPALQLSVALAVPLTPRPRPRLFLSSEELSRARERVGKYPWAAAQLEAVKRAGTAALTLKTEDIPDRGGQWSHYYVCKACGVSLKTVDPTRHQCPKCQKVYSGWPWDDVVVGNVHGRFTSAIRSLGLAYAFTGEGQYAEQARAILLTYADKYPTYAYHDSSGGESRSGGRMFAQTLDESVAIVGVAWGYDLVCEAPCFSAADRAKIEGGYLREVCRTIQRNDAGISNWQTWHNAGVAAVGFCLDDPGLAGWAINGKSGLRFQLRNSILPDGFWYEGTAAYHFYALDALRWTVEAAYHAGLDFYSDAAYRSLYEAPVQYTYPDGIFPAINDSSRMGIAGQHGLYEIAYARLQDPNFAWVAGHGKRGSLYAWLWGADELPAVAGPKLGSKDFSGLGAVALRVGETPDAAYVHFDYGPHGGGHGHPDKLAVTLWALGQEIAPDPGCLAYSAELHGSWYRQTFAHSALVVDQRSQQPTTGKLTTFASWPEVALAKGECDTAYPGVSLKHTVLLTPTYLLDLQQASSADQHQYDYVWHNLGAMTPNVPLTPRAEPLGAANGYQHLRDLRVGRGDADWSVDFKTEQGKARLTMLGTPGTELYFGTGMTGRPPAPCPMLVARRQGKQALFTSVINFSREQQDVTEIAALPLTVDGKAADPLQACALKITRGEIEDFVLIAPVKGEKRFGEITTTAQVFYLSRQGAKVLSRRQVD